MPSRVADLHSSASCKWIDLANSTCSVSVYQMKSVFFVNKMLIGERNQARRGRWPYILYVPASVPLHMLCSAQGPSLLSFADGRAGGAHSLARAPPTPLLAELSPDSSGVRGRGEFIILTLTCLFCPCFQTPSILWAGARPLAWPAQGPLISSRSEVPLPPPLEN